MVSKIFPVIEPLSCANAAEVNKHPRTKRTPHLLHYLPLVFCSRSVKTLIRGREHFAEITTLSKRDPAMSFRLATTQWLNVPVVLRAPSHIQRFSSAWRITAEAGPPSLRPACRQNLLARTFYCLFSFSDDAANTFLPSASTTLRALARFEPSLASDPLTVTSSPCLSEFRVQPARISPLGLPSSNSQLVTFPLSSFTSI